MAIDHYLGVVPAPVVNLVTQRWIEREQGPPVGRPSKKCRVKHFFLWFHLFLDPNPGKGLAHQNLNKFMWKHLDLLKLWEILDVDRLTRIKNPRVKKLELRIRIRDPVLFWPMYPGSGIGFFRIQDLGFRILNPYFWELIDNFLSKKNYNSLKIDQTFFLWHFKIKYFSIMWDLCCAANFLALLNLPKGKSLGRRKPATNS